MSTRETIKENVRVREEDKLSYISMVCSYTGKTLNNAPITVSKVIAHKITK